jgi:hypothetical protein
LFGTAGSGSVTKSGIDFSDPDRLRMLLDGDASIGDGTYFCHGFP